MSNGCVRNSKKECGDRAAGRAVHIDDPQSWESGPAPISSLLKWEQVDLRNPDCVYASCLAGSDMADNLRNISWRVTPVECRFDFAGL